jgi:hypothetical protein
MYTFGYDDASNTFGSNTKVKRYCITEAYGEDPAKCSIPNLPAMLDFTNGSLYDAIYNRQILG